MEKLESLTDREARTDNGRKNISWVHRALGMTPGHAPGFLLNNCYGLDLLSALEVALAVTALILWRNSSPWSSLAALLAIVAFLGVDLPFRNRERLARARIRRGQCGECGHELIGAHLHCPKCQG
jgi:hypothetical protein